jgi:methionine aminopeptidase
MVTLKSPAELRRMRAAGRVVARTLALVAEAARPGVSLRELDALAAERIQAEDARPSFLGYHPAWAPVPNTGRPHRGMRLREGLVLAIEPMFCEGGDDGHRTLADGWSIATADGSRAAHFEHTMAITPDGPVVLTAP